MPLPTRPWPSEPSSPAEVAGGWPSISIVTPSYNQANYLEETLLTVLGQEYPRLEYIVMEDGSTDGSPEILERYRPRLAQYVQGPNRGFGAVLQDGLRRCTGEVMAWLNSDDLYLPHTLATVGRIFHDCPEVDWITGGSLLCDGAGRFQSLNQPPGFNRTLFFSGRYLGGHPAWNGRWIPQESVFWRRSLWEKAGGFFLQERLQYGDFELWSRFWKHAELHTVPLPLGVYRIHPATYTSRRGVDSLPHCARLLEQAGEPRLTPGKIKLLDRLARLGGPCLRRAGHTAPVVRINPASGRWEKSTTWVS